MDATIHGDRLGPIAAFVRVVERGSFTAAARDLARSTSQVSRQVSALEERLGARLLHRSTRAVSPTEAGEAFYSRCARLLADLDEAEEAVAHLQAAPRGTLRLSVPMSFGVRYLAPLISSFLARYPEVRVEANFSDRRVDLVEEGFDLAVRIGALDDSSLVARRLAPYARLVVASPELVAAFGEPEHPSALAELPGLLFTYQQTGASWAFQGPDGAVSVRLSGRLSANSGEALLEAARAGLGVALLPDFLVADDLATGRLVRLLRGWVEQGHAIWAVYPHNRHLAPKVRLFVDHLAAAFGTCPPWAGEPLGERARAKLA